MPPWEKYQNAAGAAPQGPWTKYAGAGADPQARPSLGERFRAGIAQKDISQPAGLDIGDVAEFAGREGLPAIAGAFGAMGGPAGVAAAAAGGRVLQKGLAHRMAESYPELQNNESMMEALGDVAFTGLTAGVGEAAAAVAGPAIRQMASKARAGASKLGASMLRVGPGIPEAVGEAALNDLSLLSSAPTKEAVSKGYQAFEKTNSLKGLRDLAIERGNLFSNDEAESILLGTYSKIQRGQAVTPQEAYQASQLGRFLKSQAKFGDPRQLSNLGTIGEAKAGVDEFLETSAGGYKELRSDAFKQKAAEQFESWFPLNKNQSPNVLRSYSAGAAAVGGAATENYAALGLPVLISPKAAGLAIRAAYRGSQVAAPAASVAAELAARGGSINLAKEWLAQPK